MESQRRVPRTCRTEAIVDASAEQVWRVVSDVTRTSEWSHECHRITWLRGATATVPGARFRGRNRSGRLRWSRVCEIVAVDAPHQITWRTIASPLFPDTTDWRITLEPVGTRTRIVQTYQVIAIASWFDRLVARVNPRHLDRSAALAEDLHRLGAVAAAGAPTVRPAE
jgi:uncharacterized protein YndB with AHSA1/START domain